MTLARSPVMPKTTSASPAAVASEPGAGALMVAAEVICPPVLFVRGFLTQSTASLWLVARADFIRSG
jgi:hypothetical protein